MDESPPPTLRVNLLRTDRDGLLMSLLRDGVKAVCLCLFELGLLRFILAWVRCTAFVGYKKKKLNWGRIERRKIDLK